MTSGLLVVNAAAITTAVAVRIDLGVKGVWYRVQTQVFDNAAAADRLCADLKKQKIGCSLAH